MRNIILASSSPYRKSLISRLGISFTSLKPKIDETPFKNESAKKLVERLSISKAKVCHNTNQITIGSDQVASLEGQLLCKPLELSKATEQLRACSGNIVTFYSGTCIIYQTQHLYKLTETVVEFHQLNETQIQSYLKKEKPFDCAGSFKCEGLGISLFKKISSTDPTALEGISLIALTSMLREIGIDPLLD